MQHPRIFNSHSQNPFVNLALENELLQQITEPSLFLYQNSACVVIGRAQNPWLETDVAFLKEQGIPLVRRQSGGGTVVHDLGNLNFSFLSPKAEFDKVQNILLVQQALLSLGLFVEIGERQDILFEGKKVSGSAFRETKDNCFHHGTLLLQSDLELLRRCLQVPARKIISKSIPSRRSSVTNLNLDIEAVERALITTFAAHHQIAATSISLSNPKLEATIALYQSEDWIYGKTLPFTEEITWENQTITLHIETGKIKAITPLPESIKSWLNQNYNDFPRNL